jgi:MerR family transcriptional regulator, light-induced transcriptional regulator
MAATAHEGPFLNLKAVVQQTGLNADTLRAWERRYGLPSPERSGGRQRLYTRRDVDTIKWLMARQREGLSIKHAVELWRQLEAEGRDPLQTLGPVLSPVPPVPAPPLEGGTLAQLREDWLAACLVYDEQRAEQVVAQAFALYPAETVALELLQKAMAQVGEGWYREEVTVQQEHFCSALVVRRLETLIVASPLPSRPGRILAACPPGEHHVISLLLLTLLLRRRGWEVVYLGADVPAERLETTVAATRPHLVILAAQQLHTAATLLEVAHIVQRQGIPLAYGGLIFNLLPALRARIPGHFLGERLDAAPPAVEALMLAPRLVPEAHPVSEAYDRAREHYLERQGLIEADLGPALEAMGLAPRHLALANRELALNIEAALALGDMDFLGTDVAWVEGLLSHFHLPLALLHGYLRAYDQAARNHLDRRGEPILAWLGRVAGE